jgi:TRAP transporter 4TM/12TM fusion protein
VAEAQAAPAALPAELQEFSWGSRPGAPILIGVAVAFSVFQIWASAYATIPSQIVRSVHVGFLVLLACGLLANAAPEKKLRAGLLILVGVIGFALSLYHWIFYHEIIVQGFAVARDIVVGTVVVAILFVVCWLVMGPSLPILCGVFLLYGLYGHLLPGILAHRPYDYGQIIDVLFLGTEGIYGLATYVSATYIFIFIVFASFLERAGMIDLFNDVALGLVGHTQGGPAKVCILSSALMGTVNGSGIANVVASGQFTIPLMKRNGFTSAFAGGVEATSSMGGQIMPPVMGAVAFIMAETIGVLYAEIAWAAIIPAFLYFATSYVIVHLEAGKLGLKGLPKGELPNWLLVLKRRWYLCLPLIALVYLMFGGYTALFAGILAMGLTVLLILGVPIAAHIGPKALRYFFWIVLGALTGLFFKYGIDILVAMIGILIVANFFAKGGKATLVSCFMGLAEGAKNMVGVGLACALVGVLIGILALTGAATSFSRVVVEIGQDSLFLSLFLTMVTSLILGTGLPTIPSYIITASIAGPALLQLGVPLIISHMFVFYFGIMADLTPPVALAAFAAAPIAKESGMKIGWEATRIALAGYVVPFMMVYAPALMLQPGDPLAAIIGFWPAVIYHVSTAMLAITLWGATTVGYFGTPLTWAERLWAFAAAGFLVLSAAWSDGVGLAASAVFFGWIWLRQRRAHQA